MIISNYNKTSFNIEKTFFFIITTICFFNLNIVLCQVDTTYVDESNNYISKQDFYNKIKTPIYSGIRFSTDTLVMEKLRFRYFFGNLDEVIKSQLFKLLSKRHGIDTTKSLIIHYSDTLKSSEEFPKQDTIIYLDTLKQRHRHLSSYKKFIYWHKKCIRNHKKYDKYAQVFHFYGTNNGQPLDYKKIHWYKDYGLVIRKVFSDSYRNFSNIILHPDGSFFLGYNNEISYKDLVKKQKWDVQSNDFKKRIKALNYYLYK